MKAIPLLAAVLALGSPGDADALQAASPQSVAPPQPAAPAPAATGATTFTDARGDQVTAVSHLPVPPERDRLAEFQALDRDGNGAVDRSEAAGDKYLIRAWAKLDTDRDGRLRYSEMLPWLDD